MKTRAPHGLRWRHAAIAWAALTAGLCVVAAIRAESTTDFRDFWETARHFRLTGEMRSDLGVHNYLPFFTLFMVPWSLLPLRLAIVLFTALSMALFGAAVYMLDTLLAGRRSRGARPATLLAAALMLPYVVSCAVLGAMGLLLAFLIVWGGWLAERRKDAWAGTALGLAAILKLLPAALLVYFFVQLRWRIVLSGVLVVLAVGLVAPTAILGLRESAYQHRAFRERALDEHSPRTTLMAEKPRKAKYSNNAAPIVLRRILTPVDGDPSPDGPGLYVNVADLARPLVWNTYMTVTLVLVGVSLLAALQLRRHRRRLAREHERAAFGAWCCLALLAAPLMWTHYLPLAYWPLASACGHAFGNTAARGRWLSRAALVVWALCALALAWPAARAAGAQLFAVFALWAACASAAHGRPGPR